MNLNTLIKRIKRSPILQVVLVLADAVLWLIDTVAILATRRAASPTPTLVILKFDQIGDYVVWRNYLPVLLQQPAYQGYRVVLCGSGSFRQLAEYFDKNIIDEFIWVDIYKLVTRPLYRFRFACRLHKVGATVSVNPTYSRVLVLDDYLTRVVSATTRIGCVTDFTNTKRWEAQFGNRYFTQLIPTGTDIVFEVERYRRIFSGLTGKNLPPILPHFSEGELPSVDLPNRYAIIAPGASAIEKIWPMENFAAIISQLTVDHPIDWIVTGTKTEQYLYQQLRQLLPSHVRLVDTTGQFNLPQLLCVVSKAEFVLANDSGTAHLAATFRTPCVAVSNGLALGRWSPYPNEYGLPIRYVYPPPIQLHLDTLASIASNYQNQSPLSIHDVQTDDVLKEATALWNKQIDKSLPTK